MSTSFTLTHDDLHFKLQATMYLYGAASERHLAKKPDHYVDYETLLFRSVPVKQRRAFLLLLVLFRTLRQLLTSERPQNGYAVAARLRDFW